MTVRYDAVVFDWYATLAAPHGSDWWRKMFEIVASAGVPMDSEAFTRFATPPIEHFEHSADETTYRAYEDGQLLELLTSSGFDHEAALELGAELLALRDSEQVGVFSDVAGLLGELRADGVAIGLCSNWSWDLDRHLEANAITGYFDVVVCSAVVGARKPHPVIFQRLLEELDLPPERVVFIGDDWQADVEGALAAGIRPIHLAREGCSVSEHLTVACARDLAEVRTLIS